MVTSPRPVKTTQTSLQLLQEIKQQNGATLSSLVESTGLAKSTVYNHLQTLLKDGYVARDGNTFRIGLKFLELGEHARWRRPAHEEARGQVYRLAERTNEEADFTVEENGRIYTIEYAIGSTDPSDPHSGSPFLQTGSRFYAHNCASGKAILSALPQERVDTIIDRWGLPATTSNTITDRARLYDELAKTQERGYSINDEELQSGYRAIGTPVLDGTDSIVGALCVGGPTYRFELEGNRFEEMVSAIRTATTALQERIRGVADEKSETQ